MPESMLRSIHHPGPLEEPPVQSLPTRLCTVHARIPQGSTLLEGFSNLLQRYGCQSAVARLGPSSLWPVVYVLPALSNSPQYAVYYSDRHVPEAALVLEGGAVTVGLRSDDTWLHCHASWHDAAGAWYCGHLLPDETFLAQPLDVELTLLLDAGFVVCSDSHTNFSLFKPRLLCAPWRDTVVQDACLDSELMHGHRADRVIENGWCIRIAPNVDLCHTLEAFCIDQGIGEARVLGGVGSTVGAVFDDGSVVEPFVTELMVDRGRVGYVDGQMRAELDIALIDYQSGVHRGRLARGANPVLVTCELVLVAAD